MAKQASSTAEFERDYSDGELICREGESSNEMFVIQSGKVRIFKSSGPRQVDLALLEKGNFFGEMSVLEGLPRDATAQAVGHTRVLVMSRERKPSSPRAGAVTVTTVRPRSPGRRSVT